MEFKMSKKPFGNRQVSYSPEAIVSEARDLLAFAAGPRGWDDTRESWLARGAKRLGVEFSRAWNIWYGKTRRMEAAEFLNLRYAAERLREQNERTKAMVADTDRALAQLAGKEPRRSQRMACVGSEAAD